MNSRISRREFLRTAGLGSVALASLPVLGNGLAKPVWANGQTGFTFLDLSKAATLEGVDHRIVMSGDGRISNGEVEGGGSFVHFDNASMVPKTIVASGTWKAKRLASFNQIGTYGAFAAGILDVDLHLVREFPSRAVIPAGLKLVVNLAQFAGLSTGQDRGFTLTIPHAPFGPFVPLTPPFGRTVFTTRVEERD